jgi:hypothetical protein
MSYQLTLSPSRRAATRMINKVRREIQKAFAEEQLKSGINQSQIARAIGVHRSVINREIKGYKDITLGRVGELAWALGREPTIVFAEPAEIQGMNAQVVRSCSEVSTTSSTGTVEADESTHAAAA